MKQRLPTKREQAQNSRAYMAFTAYEKRNNKAGKLSQEEWLRLMNHYRNGWLAGYAAAQRDAKKGPASTKGGG